MSFPSINNQNMESNACLPSSVYRFRPSNSTLLQNFLLPKITNGYCDCQLGIIHDVDVYRYQPWDLPGKNMEECEGYYFTSRHKKNPNGSRPSRIEIDRNQPAEFTGFWKMSSKMDDIRGDDGILLGKKKFLNYFNANEVKTEWKMYEFVLDPSRIPSKSDGNNVVLDELVLCRIYKTARNNRSKIPQSSNSEGLDQQISSNPESSGQSLKRKLPAASGYQKKQEQCTKRVLALAATSMTPVKHEQPSTSHPMLARRQIPLAAEPLTQLSFPSSYDQQEPSDYKQALVAAPAVTPVQQPSTDHPLTTAEPPTQPVGELPSPLVQAEPELSLVEALSRELLSDHDNLDYSDIHRDTLLYQRFEYIYSQFDALI